MLYTNLFSLHLQGVTALVLRVAAAYDYVWSAPDTIPMISSSAKMTLLEEIRNVREEEEEKRLCNNSGHSYLMSPLLALRATRG